MPHPLRGEVRLPDWNAEFGERELRNYPIIPRVQITGIQDEPYSDAEVANGVGTVAMKEIPCNIEN